DLDREIDSLLKAISTQNKIIRLEFIKLPHNLALEVMAHYLRQNGYISFNSKLLNHVVVAAKAYANGKKFSVNAKNYILIDKNHITFKTI
ncbi:MAG TPA: hypothetical protein VMR76_03220, partial [Candidatus Saccharimonadia bacterium]|nr:hypothetical protein [Candidatus Saccharimonadia bacterium]